MRYTRKHVAGLMQEVARETASRFALEDHGEPGWQVYEVQDNGAYGDEITSVGTAREVWFELRAWFRGWQAGRKAPAR